MFRPTVLLLSFLLPAFSSNAADPDMQFTPAASVYKLRVKRAGHVVDGSAVLIAPGRLLTACHVTRGAESIRAGREELTWRAYPAGSDIDHDLCILAVRELSAAPPASIGPMQTLRPGAPVVAIGYLRGGRLDVTYGEIKGLHLYDGASVLQVSAAFDHGQSGGGLFDAAGRLIGIIGFKAIAGGDFNYALPLAWAGAAIPGQTANTSLQGVQRQAFWQRPDAGRPLFLLAASLEADRNWQSLRGVAEEWVAADQSNPASWLCLARTLAKLKQYDAAALANARAESLLRTIPAPADAPGPTIRLAAENIAPANPDRPARW